MGTNLSDKPHRANLEGDMTTNRSETTPHFKDLTNVFPTSGVGCTIGISDASNRCPLGFIDEDRWDVDENGQSNYPLCQPAIDALRPILKRLIEGKDFDSRAQCECPFNGCSITFVVHCAPNVTLEEAG